MLVNELLDCSLWKKLVIVLVLGLIEVFFFVFLVLFVDFDVGWRRSRVDLLLEVDGAEVLSGSEVVALMRLVVVGFRGDVGRLRLLVGLETVEQLVRVCDDGGFADVAVVMRGFVGDGGTGVGTLVGALVETGGKAAVGDASAKGARLVHRQHGQEENVKGRRPL